MSVQHVDDRQRHDRSLDLAAIALDFELTGVETAELEAHLATCPSCTRRAAAVRADARALSRPLTLVPSRRVDDAVYAAIARPQARPQRALLFAAAALLLVALLGVVAVGAYILRTWELLPTTNLPTPTAPVGLVSPRPIPSLAVVGETWGTFAIPASDVGAGPIGLMEAVAATDSGFVAVGRPVCVPRGDPTICRGSAWTAAQGETWTRAPDQPGLDVGLGVPLGSPEKGIFDVVAGPAGLVAVGFVYDAGGSPGIWRSPDGRAWERVPVTFGASPADAFYHRITAVAASPQGYIIVGYVVDFVDPGPSARARAAAWTSPDGLTWTRAADTADMAVGPCVDTGEDPSCGGMLAVTAIAAGFVAVGQAMTGVEGQPPQPAAWTSLDGLTWTRADAGLSFGGDESVNIGGLLSGVTTGGPGLVAVGTICQPDCFGSAAGGVVATSADGSTWSSAALNGAAPLGDVQSAGGPMFALGVAESGGYPAELQLWRSDDGIAWRRVSGLPSMPDGSGYRSADIAVAPDRAVIVGWAEVSGLDGFRTFSYVSPASATGTPDPSVSPGPTP